MNDFPSHRVHAYLDRRYFGKVYWKVHKRIDSAYPFLRGEHRIFWHDFQSAVAIAVDCYPYDQNAINSALLHLQADYACSANPLLRKQLEMLAKAEAEKRRKQPKIEKPPPLSPAFEKAIKDLEEIIRIRKILGLT